MPDYSNAKVYKLVCDDGYYYIGSTTSKYLSQRLTGHKTDSIRPHFKDNKLYSHITSIGWDKVKILLIKSVSCSNKDELRMIENEYIVNAENDTLCLNHNRAFLTEDEREIRRKECRKRDQERRNTVIKCECGVEHTVGRTAQHLSSAKHKIAMSLITPVL